MKEETSAGLLKILQGWLPILTMVGAALWTIYTYSEQQRVAALVVDKQNQRESAIRQFEAQRPFLDKQLALYFETSEVVGRLVTLAPTDPKWSQDERRFWALYWSELSMVEQDGVEGAMVRLGTSLKKYKADPSQISAVEKDALGLAHSIGASIKRRWTERIE
jgi:hypothetical protein